MLVTKASGISPRAQFVGANSMSSEKIINAQSAAGAADWGLIVKITVSPKCKFYLPAVLLCVESGGWNWWGREIERTHASVARERCQSD
jgi:hypothetical protein